MSALETLKIATPCPMKWSQMKGDDRVRRCDQCRLNVYDLSTLSTQQATEFIEARKCVRFFRRADGTVITGDCRGGFSKNFLERFRARTGVGLFAVIVAAAGGVLFASLVSLFGEQVRALYGMSETGLRETRPS